MYNLELVKEWDQFQELALLASEYDQEIKHYDAPFWVYYSQLEKIFLNNNTISMYLYTIDNVPVGYTIIYAEPDKLNSALVVRDIFITKEHRNNGAFSELFHLLYNLGTNYGYKYVKWDSKLPIETWEHITRCKLQVEYYYTVSIKDWYDNNMKGD